jgi:hypothetical protein
MIWDYLFEEDGLLEWISTVLALLSLFLSSILAYRRYRTANGYLFWLFVSLLSILVAGDEISWGERLFCFSPPVVCGVKVDGVHDLFEVGLELLCPLQDIWRDIIIGGGLLFLSLGLLWALFKGSWRYPVRPVIVCILLWGSALLIDLGMVRSGSDLLNLFLEESLELLGTFFLFLATLYGFRER